MFEYVTYTNLKYEKGIVYAIFLDHYLNFSKTICMSCY